MKNEYPIHTEATNCQDCFKCVRNCPVKAIMIEDQHASVMSEQCILCGECISACPNNSKKIRSDTEDARALIEEKEEVIVSLAPSFISEFNREKTGRLVAGLKKLGFRGVSETALGAELVSSAIHREFNRDEKRLLLSTACPSVVEYIRKYKPGLRENLANVVSPVVAHSQFLKNNYGEEVKIVFIGPCLAKKIETERYGAFDVCLTFSDLKKWFREEEIVLDRLNPKPDDDFIPHTAKNGRLYPVDGGMIAGVKENCAVNELNFMSFSGMKPVQEILDSLDTKKLDRKLFIELLACSGGCVNGPVADSDNNIVSKKLSVISNSTYEPEMISLDSDLDISFDYSVEPVSTETYSEQEISEALSSIGKEKEEDELNCGGCGYNSCRDFAEALLGGKAETNMCVSYMRNKAQKTANALLKTMPSGVVIADSELRVVECNRRFASLLGEDILEIFETLPGMKNANLRKLVPFHHIFEKVLETNEDIIGEELKFNDRVLFYSAFVIETGKSVGFICQDITEPSMKREQVVQKAEEVISKNLNMVQEIAYLLGENASETEVLMNSVIEAFKDKG
ncbi:MAG: [Fe-Fe] hydrogenase large subunit C-terminal domain-containing protein [bacterium]